MNARTKSDPSWLAPARGQLAALRARGVHAALLHGPAGIGKWDLAVSFAADVLCEAPTAERRACGACASCMLYAAGNHPDLRVVVPDALAERRPVASSEETEEMPAAAESAGASRSKPSREIRIDQVRELGALFELSSHRGGARVVLLGPAEALNLPAANALLKSLEEPPPNCFFVLVTDQPDRCLPTVLSRCILVRAALPGRAQALEWLLEQGLAEKEAAARLIEAGGAPLAALREDGEALEPPVRAMLLGLLRRGRRLTAVEVASEVPRTLPIGASVALFQRWVWDYFAFRTGAGVRYHPQEEQAFRSLSEDWSLSAAEAWSGRLRDLKAVAEHPLNPRAAVEGILLDYIASVGGRNLDTWSAGGA
jgi:DNA polymerase-3 subunit delta'